MNLVELTLHLFYGYALKKAWENNMQHQQIINKLGLDLKAVYVFIYTP